MDLRIVVPTLLAGLLAGLVLARLRSRLTDTVRAASVEAVGERTEELLRPLRSALAGVEAELRSAERAREQTQAALTTEMALVRGSAEQLRAETATLVNALRKPQARGQWGEMHLRRVVELAGMVERCDFDVQVDLRTPEGRRRPDLVVRLPEGRQIVVDAKVSLAAFLEAAESADEAVQADRLAAHARHLREHVDGLAAKSYWAALAPAPEFVVLFVPGEAFLAPALERDPALLEHAFANRVHIATPTTLISLLRTAAYGWQQAALGENARAVLDLGKDLYRRLGTFAAHLDRVGRSLTAAVGHYNSAIGSLERTVLVPARRLRDMEITGEDLPGATPVAEAVRPLAEPELVGATDGRLLVLPAPSDPEAAHG